MRVLKLYIDESVKKDVENKINYLNILNGDNGFPSYSNSNYPYTIPIYKTVIANNDVITFKNIDSIN